MTAPALTALLRSVCNPTELLSILRVCPMVPMPVPWLRVFSLPGMCFLSTRHTRPYPSSQNQLRHHFLQEASFQDSRVLSPHPPIK